MRINKMTSYGVRIISRMQLEDRAIMTSKRLAELESIPQGMVMKVLRCLKDAGIVESKQGRGEITGGFALSKDIDQVTLYDLLMAMEDEVCLYPDFEKDHYEGEMEGIFKEMKRVHNAYVRELKKHPVTDVLK